MAKLDVERMVQAWWKRNDGLVNTDGSATIWEDDLIDFARTVARACARVADETPCIYCRTRHTIAPVIRQAVRKGKRRG